MADTIKNPYLYITGFSAALKLLREELQKPEIDKVKAEHLLEEMENEYEDRRHEAMGEDL